MNTEEESYWLYTEGVELTIVACYIQWYRNVYPFDIDTSASLSSLNVHPNAQVRPSIVARIKKDHGWLCTHYTLREIKPLD